jgi:hypothetical protein
MLEQSPVYSHCRYVFRTVVNQAIKAQPLDTSKVSRYLNDVRVADWKI